MSLNTMQPRTKAKELEQCEACSPSLDEDIATPFAAYPTPITRRTTFGSFLFGPGARRSSDQDTISLISTTDDVPTPVRAFPTTRPSRAPTTEYFRPHEGLPSIHASFSVASTGSRDDDSPDSNVPSTGMWQPQPQRLRAISTPDPYSSLPDVGIRMNDLSQSGLLNYKQSMCSLHSDFMTASGLSATPPGQSDHPIYLNSAFTAASSSSLTSESIYKVPKIAPTLIEYSSEALTNLLSKFDPRSWNVPELWQMESHRDMLRTMYLDNILYATARLHRHQWILEATNEEYKKLWDQERFDLIDDDLKRYTKAVRDYEYWNTCFIQKLELDPIAIPPGFQRQGRTLAILDLASNPATRGLFSPFERQLLAKLQQDSVAENQLWSQANSKLRSERFYQQRKFKANRGLISRIVMATFGGATLIVPMLIMTLDTRFATTMVTACVFTLGIGLILAFWMSDAEPKDIIGMTAAYAAVLVVFVGTAEAGFRIENLKSVLVKTGH